MARGPRPVPRSVRPRGLALAGLGVSVHGAHVRMRSYSAAVASQRADLHSIARSSSLAMGLCPNFSYSVKKIDQNMLCHCPPKFGENNLRNGVPTQCNPKISNSKGCSDFFEMGSDGRKCLVYSQKDGDGNP